MPMSVIMLHNFVVFGLVLRVLCRKQPGGIRLFAVADAVLKFLTDVRDICDEFLSVLFFQSHRPALLYLNSLNLVKQL